jgi:leader peptidase (prepilin peptidase) / N-methyltransferase
LLAQSLGVVSATGARLSVTVAAAVLGLVIGSFLNVVVYRAPRGLSVVQPGSFCPACGTPIRSLDNVPVVSWLVLRARCRHCGEPISVRYPTVELVTGALFGVLAWALGAHWAVPGMCVLGATSLALAAIALDGLPPPASVSLIGTTVGAALLAAAAVADRRWWHLGGMLIGMAVAGCGVGAESWTPGRRGAGSTLWSLVPAGAVMGWVGAPGTIVGVSTSAAILVGLTAFRTIRPRHEGSNRALGVAVAATVGTAAALIGAFVTGSSIGT